jgi:tRNA-dihydrouridine synthase B
VFGREPEVMAEAARMAADIGASIVDINMGCPARKVTAGMCGSALMREPDLAASIVSAVRAALPDGIPVTVKHRAGWDDLSLNADAFARRMVEAGAAAIAVHGRTRDQGFSGAVRLAPIAEVRRALPARIPVVGNGDVKTVADYLDMKHSTGCDAVMIGRAARGNPWLFRDVLAVEQGHPMPTSPSVAERLVVWRHHATLVSEYAAPKMLLHELRKTLAWYSRGLHGGAELRNRGFAEPEPQAVIGLGERFFARLAERETSHAGDLREPAKDLEARCIERHARRQTGSETRAELARPGFPPQSEESETCDV